MARLTILNSMAGENFESALDAHVAMGLRDLDLKDCIFGKAVVDLSTEEAAAARAMIDARDLSVYCMSTSLFRHHLEDGPYLFARDAELLSRVVELAAILRPTLIRLLAPRLRRRTAVEDAVNYIRRDARWAFDTYHRAIARIAEAGYCATIENECHGCVLASPGEVLDFFSAIGRGDAVFTWDVQNMWQMGVFPDLAVYEQLKPILGYLHVKGGRHDGGGTRTLRWQSSLEDASWPVREIVQQVVDDRRVTVVALNPPHGDAPDGASFNLLELAGRDLRFLRHEIRDFDNPLGPPGRRRGSTTRLS
jgi:sugar phosphate isomerase/epimerase